MSLSTVPLYDHEARNGLCCRHGGQCTDLSISVSAHLYRGVLKDNDEKVVEPAGPAFARKPVWRQ